MSSPGPLCRSCGRLDPSIIIYTGTGWNEHQSCPFCKETLLVWEKKPEKPVYVPARNEKGMFATSR